MTETVLSKLEQRLGGRVYARQRLGIETDHEAQIFGQGLNFFHIENWYSVHSIIRILLKLTGLYWRGRANAANVHVRYNDIRAKKRPPEFDGFTLLHISDFHADMNDGAMRRLEEILPDLSYDLCVLTGDYRGATFGPFDHALARMRPVLARIKPPVYGVLGNHDTIRMVPDLEAMGIRLLLNEFELITRAGASIYLAGIDDAHYFRVDNIEKAASGIPHQAFSILLSHTPEIYPSGSARWVRSAAERPYPRRANLSPRIDSCHARLGSASQVRSGRVDISRDGWIYLDRRRIVDRDSANQLPPGNHIASPVGCGRQWFVSRNGRATVAGKRDERAVLRSQKNHEAGCDIDRR
jgi:hypothetical protein